MSKRKRTKRQTIQWPKEKDRQYNGQKKKGHKMLDFRNFRGAKLPWTPYSPHVGPRPPA
jgi:hypothetical protein